MKLEPVEIQHVRIGRRLFGYDPRAVDHLLEDVTASFEEVWLERDQLREEVDRLRVDIDRTRERERLLGDVLVNARAAADETLAEAKARAERTVAEARQAAEAELAEARREAEAIVAEARLEPERLRGEVERLRDIERLLHDRFAAFLASAQGLLAELDELAGLEQAAPLGELQLPDDHDSEQEAVGREVDAVPPLPSRAAGGR
ncbi:MAG TPA: DivIVA domain-containing protein [Gaiellaceae bacterium]|nr:DivIVA domain-containing protein [Gaiellaceae bacterium]HZT53270.1 DivIVA domain-containing protein [Gaiellaceae bacterium]